MDEQQFSEKLGAFIARLRSKAGYSQEAFALHCDINRTYMTVIEQGKVSISLAKTAIISGKLGLSLSQFFALFEDPNKLKAWESTVIPIPKKKRTRRKKTIPLA